MLTLQTIKAITFDVQGTCVDFVQPLLRTGEEVNLEKGLEIDWATLSFEWRGLYRNMLDEVPFDALLTAELAHNYKPSPTVYQLAVDYLGYRPDEILMVACHKYDLNAAQAFGMRTAFVARPLEFGLNFKPDLVPEPWFDLYVDSFVTLAEALGA